MSRDIAWAEGAGLEPAARGWKAYSTERCAQQEVPTSRASDTTPVIRCERRRGCVDVICRGQFLLPAEFGPDRPGCVGQHAEALLTQWPEAGTSCRSGFL